MAKSLTSDQTMTAILSYLGILVLIPFFMVKKRDDFIRFHLKQGIALLIVWVGLWLISWFLGMIPFLGGLFIWQLYNLVYLVMLIIAVIAIIKALQGEKWEIPVVSSFTELVKIS